MTISQDLRDLADFLDEHPDLAEAVLAPMFNIFADNAAEWQRLLGSFGPFDKKDYDNLLVARKQFGRIRLDINVSKEETCQRIEVGTRTVTREVYPEGVTSTIETVEEPIYEWVCPETWKDRE